MGTVGLRLDTLAAQGEDIVPAVGVEDAGQQGGAQELAHLLAGQAGLEVGHLLAGDEVALHDLDLEGLDDAGDALGLTIQKDKRGKDLIRKLCQPRKPTKADPSARCRDPQLLQELYAYCLQDVRAEQALHDVVGDLPPAELEIWQVDQIINDAGVQLDTALIANAMLVSAELSARYDAEMARFTGGAVTSCTQTKALAEWGDFYEGVSKEAIENRLSFEQNPVRRAALELRQLAGRSSIAKLERLIDWCGDDNRVRGMLQYHGATTGRWAGRGPQPQNMPRPKPGYAMPDLLAQCSAAELGLLTDDVLEVVASSLRGAYIPAAGCELGWADFSAIEARVVLWLAEQDDALEIFKRGDCIYCEMATSIYGYPVKKGMPERQDGKTIILGCGFGMGAAKFQDTANKGLRADGRPEISLETAQERVTGYRERFAMVPRLWRGLEDAARKAIQNPDTVCRYGKIAYCFNSAENFLRCRLPSGRYLHYYAPRLEQPDEDWKRPEIRYWAVKQVDGGAKVWTEVRSYGGLLTENVVQAIARDLMVAAILRIRRKFGPSGLHIILTVHDEVIYEYPIGAIDPKAIEATMAETPKWAPGCPVAAEASRGFRYGK